MPLKRTSALFSYVSGNGTTLHCAKRLFSVVSRCIVFSFFSFQNRRCVCRKKNAAVRGKDEKQFSFFL